MANVWLGWFNGFSAQPLYTTAAIATFNVLWTSLPTVAHACLDQDVRAEDVFGAEAVFGNVRGLRLFV